MEAEVWVAVVTVVGAGLAAFAGSAWQHRRRWDERRHEAEVEQAVDDFRRAYSAAELICHRRQTSRSIDEIHDALVAFSVAARSELGLPPLTFPTYSEYQREWGEA